MTQDVSLSRGEDKNSCAEANAYAENPIDLNNRAVAVRTEASSSMIEITGTSATRPDLLSRPGPPQAGPRQRRLIHEIREGFADGEVYLGFEMGKRHQFIALGAVRSNAARGYDGAPDLGLGRTWRQAQASFSQGCDLAGFTPSASAILTRSATDLAPIFFIR